MRRTASILGVMVITLALVTPVWSAEICWYDEQGDLVCYDDGTIPGDPGRGGNPPGPRYVYVAVDPVIGDCHYWSSIPGGLDSWDPINDGAVIAANAFPECPGGVPPVDVPARAWSIFRSWRLDPPTPSLQPATHGITGLPTYLSSPDPVTISHSEVLPDGRPLGVRASVLVFRVDWGDGTVRSYEPADADPYPAGTVTHIYTTKTCPPEYREDHASGGLCHPTLEYYTISAVYRWVGEYDVGSGWEPIGTLDRTAFLAYDVDEVRGVPVPNP